MAALNKCLFCWTVALRTRRPPEKQLDCISKSPRSDHTRSLYSSICCSFKSTLMFTLGGRSRRVMSWTRAGLAARWLDVNTLRHTVRTEFISAIISPFVPRCVIAAAVRCTLIVVNNGLVMYIILAFTAQLSLWMDLNGRNMAFNYWWAPSTFLHWCCRWCRPPAGRLSLVMISLWWGFTPQASRAIKCLILPLGVTPKCHLKLPAKCFLKSNFFQGRGWKESHIFQFYWIVSICLGANWILINSPVVIIPSQLSQYLF